MRTFTFKERFAVNLNLLPTAVYDALPAVLFGRMLVLALKFGVFESLDRHPQTAHELTCSLKLHAKSVELILPALVTSNYLKKRGEKYFLASQAKKWLVKSSPHYIGNFLAYIELLHSHWMYLEETLEKGKPPQTYIEMFNEKEWQIYTLGMMDLAKLILPRVLPKLKLADHARTLLDLCGSHGLYTIELCKRHTSLQATIADLPQVLTTTQHIIKEHNLSHRITTMPCDVLQTTFVPESFDVVLAFNIVHGFDVETNRKFFRTISTTVKRGGEVYILDQLKDERSAGIDRLLPLMVGLNLLNEIGGNVYTFREIQSMCTEAGLTTVKHSRLTLPGVSLVKAVKQ